MNILVTGAYGFIGRQVVAELLQAGHRVVCGVRNPEPNVFAGLDTVFCDFAHDVQPDDWLPRLADIDVVVNCAGILRELKGQTFDAVHRVAPCALFDACVQAKIKRVVQVSALGNPADGAFILSKHAADEYLASLPVESVVLRPSVVYSTSGSYGGTSLMRALSAIPWVVGVPGRGDQVLQPITGEDLAAVIVAAVEREACANTLLQVVGPEPLSFRDYLLGFRQWLGVAPPVLLLRIPVFLIGLAALLGQWLGRGPLGLTMYRMLQRGNVGEAGAYTELVEKTAVEPMGLARALSQRPAFVQDRWHARLYLLRPLLRLLLASVWIVSGVVGFITPQTAIEPLAQGLGLPLSMAMPLVYAVSILDVLLGVCLLLGLWVTVIGALMLVSVLAYTLIFGMALPHLWLDPLGGLLKNLIVIPSVPIMLAIERIR